MASRLDLQTKLETLLGSRNVYYQPPETIKMNYPAIVYFRAKPNIRHANDEIYMKTKYYEIIVISRNPEEPVISSIEDLPMCSWSRHFVSENLHHDVLNLYF